MTAQPPRRRWPRRLGIALAVIVGLGAALWLAAPTLITSIANRRLPHRVDTTLVVERVHASPPTSPMDLVVRCSGSRLRAIAAVEGVAIPPLVLRQGLCADARWDDRESAPELPLGLRLIVDRQSDPPALAAILPALGLNALIARNHVEPEEILGQSMHYVYRLDPGSTARDDGTVETTARGVRRRIRVEASGAVAFTLGSDRCEIRVS
ncbi:MAG: hypothetical protein H0W72_12120, partial [Planctomycetes bacterium]|nr:hypothetical protein [Planctomycetota bacterium]